MSNQQKHNHQDPEQVYYDLFGEPAIPRRRRRRFTYAPDRGPACHYPADAAPCLCAYADSEIAILDIRPFRRNRRWNVEADVCANGVTLHNVTCDGRAIVWPHYNRLPAASIMCRRLRLKAETELLRLTQQVAREMTDNESEDAPF